MLKEQYKDLSKGTYYLLPDIIDMIQVNINKFWEYGETLSKSPVRSGTQPVNQTAQPQPTLENKSSLGSSAGKGKVPLVVPKEPTGAFQTSQPSMPAAPRINTTVVPRVSASISSAPPVSSKKRNIADSFKFAADQDRALREFVKQDAQSVISGSWMQSEAWIRELEMYPELNNLHEVEEMDDEFDEWANQGNFLKDS
jgi:hypothetical protein